MPNKSDQRKFHKLRPYELNPNLLQSQYHQQCKKKKKSYKKKTFKHYLANYKKKYSGDLKKRMKHFKRDFKKKSTYLKRSQKIQIYMHDKNYFKNAAYKEHKETMNKIKISNNIYQKEKMEKLFTESKSIKHNFVGVDKESHEM